METEKIHVWPRRTCGGLAAIVVLLAAAGAWGEDGAGRTPAASLAAGQKEHWAYHPVKRPDLPAARDGGWARNAIDTFILARLEAADIEPSPEADRVALIRRLSHDLRGLPPSPGEVDAFLEDASPGAFERLADRFLASPAFGEHWGRRWLDKARYADSDGYEKDNHRPDAWRYRDWVIDAINADLSFDQFTIEQLAGDLLPGAAAMERLATAFHRQTLTNTEGGVDQEQFRVEAVVDRTNTTGAVWLGHTVGCAQCHSHKHDRLSHREYYQLFAFFNGADETTAEVPISDEALAERAAAKAAHDQEVALLEERIASHRAELAPALESLDARLRAAREAAKRTPPAFLPLEVVKATSRSGARLDLLEDGSILARGDPADKDAFNLVVKAAAGPITGFRLECLTDESLPAKGPGRSSNGNFVLSEFRIALLRSAEEAEGTPISLERAEADFTQKGFAPALAIDGRDDTGWAIAPRMGTSHRVTFGAALPVTIEQPGCFLRVHIAGEHGGGHQLGRFRLLAMIGDDPDLWLPPSIQSILSLEPGARDAKQSAELLEHFASMDLTGARLREERRELEKKAPKSPYMKARVLQAAAAPRTTRVLARGDFLEPGEEVEPGTPAALPPLEKRGKEGSADRLDLARWLVHPSNTLTPRVTANHVWDALFGQGIVRTVGDFGVKGERPSHPELLDWLADELLRLRWSRKAFVRLVVTSAAYRQASTHRPGLVEIDPQNILLHRQNRFRLGAEAVRDFHLAAAGILERRIGGPSVFPPMPPEIAKLSYAGSFTWTASTGADRWRRGMYTFWKRTAPHPTLMAFDCPDANTACVKRSTSNTPLQALALLNNEVFVEAARALARRVLAESPGGDRERIERVFLLCVARPPGPLETERFLALLSECHSVYRGDEEAAKAMAGSGASAEVEPAEAAAWAATARIVLNLDELITRE
ncbi:MAG TPA: DUF1549 and DUF1553 domain-containing protein [Planctomycetota bacterium]|nr:DUF1549 and DUF1553 domain-containing protein [Planctomycetota bacterium]